MRRVWCCDFRNLISDGNVVRPDVGLVRYPGGERRVHHRAAFRVAVFGDLVVLYCSSGGFGGGATSQVGASAGRHVADSAKASAIRTRRPAPRTEPQVCDGCVPPLTDAGGPVMTGVKGCQPSPRSTGSPAVARTRSRPATERIIDGYIGEQTVNLPAYAYGGSNPSGDSA